MCPSVCLFFIFACTQQSGWSSVCVSMPESWAGSPCVIILKRNPENSRQKCPELEYVVSGWQPVMAVLLKVGVGASLISTCTYKAEHTPRLCICYFFVPKDCAPLTRTRLDKAHVHRRVCKQLVVHVYEIYANWETTTFSFLKKFLLISIINMGPVTQSIFSLTSSLRGQLVKYFTTLQPNTLICLVDKKERSFSYFFQQKCLCT